jgi:CO/xanthine dehydrogenase Mo-binding subunit
MNTSRRTFIKTTGSLTIGFTLIGGFSSCSSASEKDPELPRSLRRYPTIDAWLRVLDDGKVQILTGKMELGQGIRTAIAQVAAEELNLKMENVVVILAETGRTPNEGYTAGSGSIEGSAMSVRYAAAYAKQRLLALAAAELQVSVGQLQTASGTVQTKDGTHKLTFLEILKGRELKDEIHMPVALKPRNNYYLVGKAISRADIGRMVRGEPVYVQDLRFPGMVHARTIRPPVYGAKLIEIDQEAVKRKVPGLLKIVVNGSFLGVIAKDEYPAIQAQTFVIDHAQWSYPPSFPETATKDLAAYLKALPVKTTEVAKRGNITASSDGNASLKASYFKPYIMHGSIGPSCAVARYEKGMLDVWTHSQGVYPLRDTLGKMLDLPVEKIHVKGVPGSGCYGHNGADDAAADAALLAMAYPGTPIRLQWSRDEENAWEPYGSAMMMDVEARLDPSGRISHWWYNLRSDSHGARPGGDPGNLIPAQYLAHPFHKKAGGFSGGAHRNAEPYYSIPNLQVNAHIFEGPLRTSSLRSLGAYANIFAMESFMDELAEMSKTDPYEFRLKHLDDERAKAVIRKVRELIVGQPGRSTQTNAHKGYPGSGMGLAFSRYENSKTYCAVVAQVQVDSQKGSVQVQKMWAAIDAGEVINLDGIKNQIEGGMIQSASWTLKEQVRFNEKQITSRDWDTYPIFRFNDIPEVEVAVLDHPAEKALGAGEAIQGPAAAAIANAVYHSTGKRIRSLPIVLGKG